ncbi:hypothetical protein [Actinoplanes sp. NPDC026623]|uniref:hypothetical protein n=1 Tax=Actinoplanes sp. NPDC026623 TaxID=3155610 RepID=UPI0033E1B6C6
MTQPAISADTPAALRRPAAVTVAFALQVALAGTLLLMVGVAIADAVHYDALIDQAARAATSGGDDAGSERAANLSSALLTAVPALLLAAWLGITAIWVRRGSNVARILTLVGIGAPVLLGALACVFGSLFGLLLVGLITAAPGDGFTDGEELTDDESFTAWEGSDFYARLDRLDGKGWSVAFDVLGMVTVIVALLLAVATVVLLLTSTSHRFFRPWRPAPLYRHPAPFHGYPAPFHGYPAPFHGYPAPPPCPYPPAHWPGPGQPPPTG